MFLELNSSARICIKFFPLDCFISTSSLCSAILITGSDLLGSYQPHLSAFATVLRVFSNIPGRNCTEFQKQHKEKFKNVKYKKDKVQQEFPFCCYIN